MGIQRLTTGRSAQFADNGGGGGGGAVGDIIDGSGSTSDGYATVIDVFQADGLIGIGSIENVLGANSLTVRETVTDKFGVTTQIEVGVPASSGHIFDLQTVFDDGMNPPSRPPFVSYTVEVKSTAPGDSTDYELHYIDITPTSGGGGGGASDFEMSFSGTLSNVQNNLIPIKTKRVDTDVDQLDVELQEASQGGDTVVEFFYGVTSLGTVTVAAGTLSGSTPISLVTIPANTRVSARILSCGTTTIAITASFFVRTAI